MKFKNVIIGAMLAVSLIAAASKAQAQIGEPTQLFNSANLSTKAVTNNAAAGTTNIYTMPREAKELGLGISFALNGAGTSNLVVNLDKSVGGTKWSSLTTLTVPANGTTEVVFTTNLTVNAITAVRARVTANVDSTSLVTNLVIRAAGK